jgi:transcriptional regulator with XRE-family HTH domain
MEAKDYIEALMKTGLTQMGIAEKTGIPQPTISKVARGDVVDVMSRNYRKLQALYVELGLGDSGKRPARRKTAGAEG